MANRHHNGPACALDRRIGRSAFRIRGFPKRDDAALLTRLAGAGISMGDSHRRSRHNPVAGIPNDGTVRIVVILPPTVSFHRLYRIRRNDTMGGICLLLFEVHHEPKLVGALLV